MVSLHWHELLSVSLFQYQLVSVLLLTLPMPLWGGYSDYVNCFSLRVAALLSAFLFLRLNCSKSLAALGRVSVLQTSRMIH